MSHLVDSYKAAITDFYGTGRLCIYKTGPAWPVGGDQGNLVRDARPIYGGHPMAPTWRQIAQDIITLLDSLDPPVKWNTIDALAYANDGEATPFCDCVVIIGVIPGSLAFENAKSAAEAAGGILGTAGFPEVQVAMVESTHHRWGSFAS